MSELDELKANIAKFERIDELSYIDALGCIDALRAYAAKLSEQLRAKTEELADANERTSKLEE